MGCFNKWCLVREMLNNRFRAELWLSTVRCRHVGDLIFKRGRFPWESRYWDDDDRINSRDANGDWNSDRLYMTGCEQRSGQGGLENRPMVRISPTCIFLPNKWDADESPLGGPLIWVMEAVYFEFEPMFSISSQLANVWWSCRQPWEDILSMSLSLFSLSELSEGRVVLWGPLPAVGRLYRPTGGLYGWERGLGRCARGEWGLERSTKRAGGLWRWEWGLE